MTLNGLFEKEPGLGQFYKSLSGRDQERFYDHFKWLAKWYHPPEPRDLTFEEELMGVERPEYIEPDYDKIEKEVIKGLKQFANQERKNNEKHGTQRKTNV